MADRIDSPGSTPAPLNLRRLERIQSFLQYAAVLVLLVFVGLIVVSYFQLRRIRREIAAQQTLLDKRKLEIKELEASLENRRKVISGLQETTLALTEDNPKEGARAREAVERSIAQISDVEQLPARIYMQIAREDQRRRAAAIARALQAEGYIVPGIENVRDKAPDNSQLRYCGDGKNLPEDLDSIIKALERISVSVTRQPLARCGNVRPRHYEIWLGENY
jgi:septal ring factor EnvC (AmiA/AmiB activator)